MVACLSRRPSPPQGAPPSRVTVLDFEGAPIAACEKCGDSLRWESLEDGGSERWLGVCSGCGWMRAFLHDEPSRPLDDPLSTFLGATRLDECARPPWIRAMRASASPPWSVRWSHRAKPCDSCSAPVVFTTTHPRTRCLPFAAPSARRAARCPSPMRRAAVHPRDGSAVAAGHLRVLPSSDFAARSSAHRRGRTSRTCPSGRVRRSESSPTARRGPSQAKRG